METESQKSESLEWWQDPELVAEATADGIDLNQLWLNSRLTMEERIRQLQRSLNMAEMLREAVRKAHSQ